MEFKKFNIIVLMRKNNVSSATIDVATMQAIVQDNGQIGLQMETVLNLVVVGG